MFRGLGRTEAHRISIDSDLKVVFCPCHKSPGTPSLRLPPLLHPSRFIAHKLPPVFIPRTKKKLINETHL